MEPHTTPIGEHGFLSDCHTAALVTPSGEINWLCVPGFDGPAFMAGLLDPERGGGWTLQVEEARPVARDYADDSLVLDTLWEGAGLSVLVRDLLAVGRHGEELYREGVLLRVIECRAGRATVRSRVEAKPDYGRAAPGWEQTTGGALRADSGPVLSGDPPPTLTPDGDAEFHAVLTEGQSAVLCLDYLALERRLAPRSGHEMLQDTLDAWAGWTKRSRYSGVGTEYVHRSAATLRGLLYDETGGLVAAPTTSLPEWPGEARNWDYRYVWHRDASLVVLSFLRLGHAEEAGRYLRFLQRMCGVSGGWVPPVRSLDGGLVPDEEILDHLRGYADSRPVRRGNDAHFQRQLDVYGHVLDAALCYQEVTGELGPRDVEQLNELVEAVRVRWREPDDGIWEVRGSARHWTNSKVYAWVCLDRAVQLAHLMGTEGEVPLEDWRRDRDAIHEEVLNHGYDAGIGSFVQSYGATNVDGSLLRIPLLGFLAGDDPRVLGTLDRVESELGEGGYLIHRYDPEVTDDGLRVPEGAFLMCSFDMVSALVLAGRSGEARERFDKLCAQGGPLGLYAEEMCGTGEMLGNFPQAFTHLALIEAAVNLNDAGDEEALHRWARARSAGAGGGA